jgi:hypothetical protein
MWERIAVTQGILAAVPAVRLRLRHDRTLWRVIEAALAGAIAAALVVISGTAEAATIIGLYNTGVDNGGAVVSSDGADQHWSLNGGPAYTSATNGNFPPAWMQNDSISLWITPTPNAGQSLDPSQAGFYAYTLTFQLTAEQASNASFTGQFAADSIAYSITLNGNLLGTGGGEQYWTAFGASPNDFVAGTNTLVFNVENWGPSMPTGLRVEFLSSGVKVLPSITCAASPNVCPTVWWFNGASPQPNNYVTTLQATTGGTDYTWRITGGALFAQFSNGSSTIDTNSTPTVDILPTTADPGDACGRTVVTVTVTVTSTNGTVTSGPIPLTLNKPKSLFYVTANDYPIIELIYGVVKVGEGYESHIIYELHDLCDKRLPVDVPVNEKFGPIVKDDHLSFWPQPSQEAGPQPPMTITDTIRCVNSLLQCQVPPAREPLQVPPFSLGNHKIDHWMDSISAGSTTPGAGVLVATFTFQRFQDHGRHCHIFSPPGSPGNYPNPRGC